MAHHVMARDGCGVKMAVWRRWCDGVMPFVDGYDSGQKTMGVGFGIPLHAICDKWRTWKHVTELNF